MILAHVLLGVLILTFWNVIGYPTNLLFVALFLIPVVAALVEVFGGGVKPLARDETVAVRAEPEPVAVLPRRAEEETVDLDELEAPTVVEGEVVAHGGPGAEVVSLDSRRQARDSA